MMFGYVRVSSLSQKLDRQLNELIKFGVDKKNIYADKQSGKNFIRKSYQQLIKRIKQGDIIVIKSIDRLGRNYEMIRDQWMIITKIKKVDIVVLDMPLLDTRNKSTLIGSVISDLVLELLSFVAESERTNIKNRQAEGIKIAKQKGIKFGRPKIQLREDYKEICMKYQNREISCNEAISFLNVSRTYFFNLLKHQKSLNQ